MKYYIKSFFSDFHEVNKEQFDKYKQNLIDRTPSKSGKKYLLQNFFKVEN